MKSLALIVLILITFLKVHAQCNTTLNKLLPESSINNNDRYGSALAATDEYLIVAAENSDSLGVLYGGVAFLYEKTPAGWAYRAMLKPSDPTTYDFFGNDVEIDPSGNTVYIINRRYSKGVLYIFEKPASGWETMTETSRIEFPDFFEWTATVNIKPDGSKLVIGSAGVQSPKFYVLAKPITGWNSTIVPEIITGPQSEFGIDILLHGEYLYVSADNDDSGNGIYVYKSQGSSYQYLAKLSVSSPFGSIGYFGRSLTATDDMVASMGGVSLPGDAGGYRLFIFKKDGEWTDATETINTKLPIDEVPLRFPFPIVFISPTELAASILLKEGDSYTGKVLLTKASDNTWQQLTGNVLYEQRNLASNSDFALNMVWNGSELIRSVEPKNMGFASRDAVMSLTRSGNIWGSQQQVTLPRYNSSDFRFGFSVHKNKEALFAGSPYDGTMGKGAGAVYVYERSGEEFTRKHVIVPTPRKVRVTGGSDAGFGYSIASSGEELAVGAPSYLYSPSLYGKIFLFKRTTPSWKSAVVYDSVSAPPELKLNHIGAAVAMNDRYLFASAYNNLNNEHTNAVLVYEKVGEKWQFKQVVNFGKPIDKSWPSIRLSLFEDELMVGSYFAIGGGVFILSKNPSTGNWEVKTSFDGAIFSGYGADVKLFENHFFVGVPGYAHQGVAQSGGVFVYAKLPEQEWNSSMQPVAIIGANVAVEGGFFGSSIDVVGNTLAVGAPGKFLTNDNQVRTVPGNTYIFQTQDYFWQTNTEFLNLQGDRYSADERDYFGSDVGIDEEYFYIGSSNEHTARGSFSGASYYIPTPPVIFLHPPVCESELAIQLQAYPFGGSWSGQGVDASGRFEPASVGPGTFTLTYRTPNCSNEGTVKIDVKPRTVISQVTPANVKLCSEGQVTLQVSSSVQGAVYEWYYKPEAGINFQSMGMGGAQKSFTNPGEYFARLYQGTCFSDSPLFYVTIDGVTLSIGPQDIVCGHNQIMPLKISISSGTWSGLGVQNQAFNSGDLSNGTYEVSYRFTSPGGCDITVKDSVLVRIIEPVVITRAEGDFCEMGSALLQTNLSDNDLTYAWYFAAQETENRTEIQQPLGFSATVFEQGYYHVAASNGDCEVSSEPVKIGFETDLSYALLPEENSTEKVCDQPEYTLEVSSREGAAYTWFYQPVGTDPFEEVSTGTGGQLQAKESGYYKVTGQYGFCSFESAAVNIVFATDSIFVPNVFTPNGDTYNPYFEVLTNTEVSSITVINRYGRNVFTATGNQPWSGGDVPAGIYYWLVQYKGCNNDKKERKGWVQLIR
jgi:gliding motility-associated-like protein